jgi:hypothetical protein
VEPHMAPHSMGKLKCLVIEYSTLLVAPDKRSSLFFKRVSYGEKSFMSSTQGCSLWRS